MIKTCCDICLKEIPQGTQPNVCEKHMPFADQFYKDQWDVVRKAVDGHRQRFLQTVINKPRPLEAVK